MLLVLLFLSIIFLCKGDNDIFGLDTTKLKVESYNKSLQPRRALKEQCFSITLTDWWGDGWGSGKLYVLQVVDSSSSEKVIQIFTFEEDLKSNTTLSV